jgi:hypothetical protein
LVGGQFSTYQYVDGDPLYGVDPRGLYTEIIRWATDGSASGAWGHISGNLNGENYSWGPKGWDKSFPTASAYEQQQVNVVGRNGHGIVLNLSPVEEFRLRACLRKHRFSKYNAVTNNCGNPWVSCLQELHIVAPGLLTPDTLPEDVLDLMGNSDRAMGQTRYFAPGNKDFDIPPIVPLWQYVERKAGF